MSKMKRNSKNTRQPFANTRKVLRKQKRQQKKVHRQEHYMKKKNVEETPVYTSGKFVKRPAESPEPDSKAKKKKKASQPLLQDIIGKERQKELKETARLKSQMEDLRKKQLYQANEDEDKVIKKLEKQLGLNKLKNKKNLFADDGLDYLLEICDRATSEQIVAAEKHLAEVDGESDFEEDLAVVTGREVPSKKDNKRKQKGDQMENEESESDNDLDEGGSEDMDEDQSGDGSNDEMSGNELGDESDGGDFDDDDFDGSDPEDDDDMSDSEPKEKPTKSSQAKSKSKDKTVSEKPKVATDKSKTKKERIVSAEELSKVFSDDEVSRLSGDDDDDMAEFNDDEKIEEKEKEKPDVWEDIYGRKRDKEGNVIKEEKGVYIPPHLRNKDSGSEKELAQLKRQIKSVLNKLAGTNLHWACTSLERLYGSHSRHAVNSALSAQWLAATAGASATPDRMLAEHAALVAVLHANVGSEIGAHFLQEMTKKFDEMMQTPQPIEDKTLDNLVSCLAYLYSFKIYHAGLLYDIFARLLAHPSEKCVGCVVCALRAAGGALRRDQPAALKAFIQDAQVKLAGASEAADTGTRIKFLLEILMAVKNNNLNKIPNYEPTYAEDLKKASRGVIRKGNYVTPLNIRLEDLLKAEERGKWWVVGSAWEGSRPLPAAPRAPADSRLAELARAQRMNTDVRRDVFCVIMAAEDYMDAFEKLQHLGLKGQQEREIVHVLLACCLQEKTYNPYYAVLAQKLCDTDRKYQLSIQFATWDKIKELDTLPKHSATNLAQLLVHLVMNKGLALSVLKVIQFSDLNKHTVRFMRQILLAIIMNEDLEAALEVFRRVAKPPALRMFRESVRLFARHFLGGRAGRVLGEEDAGRLQERIAQVDKVLTMHENKMML